MDTSDGWSFYTPHFLFFLPEEKEKTGRARSKREKEVIGLSTDRTARRGRRPASAVGGFAAYGGGVPLAGVRRPVPPEPPCFLRRLLRVLGGPSSLSWWWLCVRCPLTLLTILLHYLADFLRLFRRHRASAVWGSAAGTRASRPKAQPSSSRAASVSSGTSSSVPSSSRSQA